ncbi:unnamed protein product [Lathyrus sativus]|nr:unnamed protein product [Lathyrus sativus]
MGFPTEVVLPKVFIQLLSVLASIRKLVTVFFCYFGFESDFSFPETTPEFQSMNPRLLIREILPVVKFSELELAVVECSQDGCAVCLYEFKAEDEIQRLRNCRHLFHKHCLDRWMGYYNTTCPLCRTSFLPQHHMQEDR